MKFLRFLLVLLSFCSTIVLAQENSFKQCDSQLALQLVEQQAIESGSETETDKRINILIRVSEFLWDKDEAAARKYFAEAFKIARERFAEKGRPNTSTTPFLIQREPDYRFLVIRSIVRFDSVWAEKLNREIIADLEDEENTTPREEKEHLISQTLETAILLVDTNPALARVLFGRAMKYPLINSWYFTLYRVSLKHKDFADELYIQLLNNYRNSGIGRLLYLSAYPFAADRTFGLDKYAVSFGGRGFDTYNKGLQKQFLFTLLNRIVALTPDTAIQKDLANTTEAMYAVSVLTEIEPIISADFPELTPLFMVARNSVTGLLSAEDSAELQNRDKSKNQFGKSFDEFLLDVEKASEDGKLNDMMIVSLIFKAKEDSHFEKAAGYLDTIKDENVRESSANYFHFSRAKLAVKEGRPADARKYAEKVRLIQHQAVIYFDIAELKLKEPLTRIESLEVLTQVTKIADRAPDSVEKAQVLLGLAFMYEKIDPFNAFDSLSNAIKTANNLESPNLFTSFISQQIIGQEFAFFAGYTVPGFDVSRTFDEISKRDFQGALAQAKGFSDKYVRTLAVLATVKDCREPVVEPPPTGSDN